MTDFLDMIQSSETEIYNYLNFIEAYQIDGEYFCFEFNSNPSPRLRKKNYLLKDIGEYLMPIFTLT